MDSGYKYKLQQQQEQKNAALSLELGREREVESARASQVQSEEGIHIRATVPDAIPAPNVIEHVVDTNPAAAAAARRDLCSSSAHSGGTEAGEAAGASIDHHRNGA